MRDGFQKRFEVAVLITNDSDLAEPVRIVLQELALPVGLLNPPGVLLYQLSPSLYLQFLHRSKIAFVRDLCWILTAAMRGLIITQLARVRRVVTSSSWPVFPQSRQAQSEETPYSR